MNYNMQTVSNTRQVNCFYYKRIKAVPIFQQIRKITEAILTRLKTIINLKITIIKYTIKRGGHLVLTKRSTQITILRTYLSPR